jgi:hypothetical protein
MSAQFFYIKFSITPKSSLSNQSVGDQSVLIELPRKFISDWKLERPGRNITDEEIAIDLAYPVAIATAKNFAQFTNRPIMHREIHSPEFHSERLSLMNERACDYENNGIRAWFAG